MKVIRIAGLALLLLAAGCNGTEKTEATTAEIEAAQMEGRNAAKEFVSRDLSDTLKMQHHTPARRHAGRHLPGQAEPQQERYQTGAGAFQGRRHPAEGA